jgi:hypothetical protein
MNFRNLVALATLALAVVLAVMTSGAAPTKAAPAPCTVPGTHATIQSAVNDLTCTTITVAAGTYAENVIIPSTQTGLALNGAQAGIPVSGRTFGVASESTINGQVTVKAANVTIDGFSLTQTVPAGAVFGIVVKAGADGAVISNNIIDTVTTPSSTAQAIYLENSTSTGSDGADNVSILDNRINNVQSDQSAKGILIGVNGGTDPSQNTLIQGNSITNITSNRGAYGVSVGNTIGVTGLEVRNNAIDNLTGGLWAHAIGLEGDTPGAEVTGNCISDVVDLTTTPYNDAAAVLFESNPSFGSAEVHANNFTNVAYGIAVNPALSAAFPLVNVDGENNWWGSASGPGPVGPGTGAKVTPNVDYTPWLTAPAFGGACGGPIATSKDQCKNGGWATVFRANGTAFKNQGDCIQYVNTGK